MSDQWAQFEDEVEAKGYALIPNAVLRNPYISLSAKSLYAILKSYAWQDASTYPGIKTLCNAAGVSKDTLGKYLRELVSVNLIEVKRRGRGQTNLYTFKSVNKFLEAYTGSNPESDTGSHQDGDTGSVLDGDTGSHNEDTVDKDSVDNPTGSKETLKPVAIENRTQSQTLTDDFYRRLLDRYKARLEKEEYSYHLGSFRNMLNKDEPTEEEIDRVLAHMVEVFPASRKIRATKALQDVRLGRDTGEAWSGPAPWEKNQEKSFYEKKYATNEDARKQTAELMEMIGLG